MKTLHTIQTLSKVGKVLSTIVFVISLVGAILCIVGIVGLSLLPNPIDLGGVTIQGLVEVTAELTREVMTAVLSAAAVMCVGEAVLAKMAQNYFANELVAGTPFTFAGAKELKRLGIWAICIPLITQVIASIVFSVLQYKLTGLSDMNLSFSVSIGLGVMMIVGSVLCKYGTEVQESAYSENNR